MAVFTLVVLLIQSAAGKSRIANSIRPSGNCFHFSITDVSPLSGAWLIISRALHRAASTGSVNVCRSMPAIWSAKSRGRARIFLNLALKGSTFDSRGCEMPMADRVLSPLSTGGRRRSYRRRNRQRLGRTVDGSGDEAGRGATALRFPFSCAERAILDLLGITGCSAHCPAHSRAMAEELAKQAWFLRVQTTEAKPAIIDFAVGKATLQEAIAAVLYHPELDMADQVTLSSQMSPIEISSCRIRPNEVRTYGRRIYKGSAVRAVLDQAGRR